MPAGLKLIRELLKKIDKVDFAKTLPESAKKTALAPKSTEKTYQRLLKQLSELSKGNPGTHLDVGAGKHNIRKSSLFKKSQSYEPFPQEGHAYDFTNRSNIPPDAYDAVSSFNVANVIQDPKDMMEYLQTIVNSLKRGGHAVIKARSDINPRNQGPRPKSGTFQRALSTDDLLNLLNASLEEGKRIEPIKELSKNSTIFFKRLAGLMPLYNLLGDEEE